MLDLLPIFHLCTGTLCRSPRISHPCSFSPFRNNLPLESSYRKNGWLTILHIQLYFCPSFNLPLSCFWITLFSSLYLQPFKSPRASQHRNRLFASPYPGNQVGILMSPPNQKWLVLFFTFRKLFANVRKYKVN